MIRKLPSRSGRTTKGVWVFGPLLRFEEAARLRDEITELKRELRAVVETWVSTALGEREAAPVSQGEPPLTGSRATREPVPRRTAAMLIALVVLGAVLRVWWSRAYGLSFDETFTAMAARRPVGSLFSYLAHFDSHPPLDYLIRAPLARAGVSDFLLRSPSLVFSVSALALFAWWMRRRGWAGVVATGLLAISGFAIAYGAEARMYALLELLGIAAAMLAESWLRQPKRWHPWAVAGLVLVGCLDHVSMFLVAAGLVVLAGVRVDRDAWRWRAGVVVGIALWAPLWGPSLYEQAGGHHSSWIPPTSARGFVDAIVGQVTFTYGVIWLVALAVVAGAICLARSDRTLARVWVACGLVPFVLAGLVGLFTPFFLNRTLTAASWAPALAVGMLVDAARRRQQLFGVFAVVALIVLAIPGTASLLGGTWEYDVTIGHLEASARPGDVLAVDPTWYDQLVGWRVGVRAPLGATRPVRLSGIPGADALAIEGAPRTGRVWLLEYGTARPALTDYRRCGPLWTYGETRILCLEPAP